MMSRDQEEQFIVWQRYRLFQQMGMRESYIILYNGWLVMDYVLANSNHYKGNLSKIFLTDAFLE